MILASEFNGIAILTGKEVKAVEKLIIILDGTDLDFPLNIIKTIKAKEIIVFTLGCPSNLLSNHFPEAKIVMVENEHIIDSFNYIKGFINGNNNIDSEENTNKVIKKSVFVSHAVKDELIINKVINYLRKYFNIDIFTCSDSIPSGEEWQKQIYNSLVEKDCFLIILSENLLKSHFCSFEAGYAVGLKKDIYLISLDGSMPHNFFQHIQTANIQRLKAEKPWMTDESILKQEILKILQ